MSFDAELDAKGLNCPLPILRAKKAIGELTSGQVLKIRSEERRVGKECRYRW